jgi:hypothetical protein
METKGKCRAKMDFFPVIMWDQYLHYPDIKKGNVYKFQFNKADPDNIEIPKKADYVTVTVMMGKLEFSLHMSVDTFNYYFERIL